MPAYVALAHSLVEGRGLSYSGMPSAFRPPLYPMFLAGNIFLFGAWFPFVVRAFQFLAGILAALVCWLTAKKLWNEEQALISLAATMAFPALIFFTGELLTECLATLITSLFVLLIVDPAIADKRNAILVGIIIGIGTLLRFNLPVLGIIYSLTLLHRVGLKRSIVPAALAALVSFAFVSPWLIRNLITFHSVLLSSQTGYNLVEGVLTPDGRAQSGEIETLQKTMGWTHEQLETNSPSRLQLQDEVILNRRAFGQVPALWNQNRSHALRLVLQKLGYFWFSTDQAFETRLFSTRQRIIRFCGTCFYWLVLILAVAGWFKLRASQPENAGALLIFAATVTLFHLPFVMNTRLATPFLAPLICVLSPGAVNTSTRSA